MIPTRSLASQLQLSRKSSNFNFVVFHFLPSLHSQFTVLRSHHHPNPGLQAFSQSTPLRPFSFLRQQPREQPTMAPLRATSGSLIRACTRQQQLQSATAARPAVTSLSQQRRGRADAASSTFESPFAQSEKKNTLKIPSFKKYASNRGETSNKVFGYFMAGSMGLITAVGAKATVQGRLFSSAASYGWNWERNWKVVMNLGCGV